MNKIVGLLFLLLAACTAKTTVCPPPKVVVIPKVVTTRAPSAAPDPNAPKYIKPLGLDKTDTPY